VNSLGTGVGAIAEVTTLYQSPTLMATASETGNVAGSATLQDSAVLAAGLNPTGTITFTLTAPDGTTSTIGSDTVSGNSTYLSPTFTATEAGTYTWHASYSGDIANNPATDQGGTAQQSVTIATPVVVTGTDSITSNTTATLSGTANAQNAATSVQFQYSTSSSFSSNVTTVTASPNSLSGVTTTSESASLTGLLPGVTYYYRLVASNAAGTTDGAASSFLIPQLTTALSATALQTGGTIVGSSVLQDSAVLNAGFAPTGSITFTLTQPDNTTITIGSVTVSGDNTYLSPTFTTTEVGVYTWNASYGGDVSNISSAAAGGAFQQSATIKASPTIVSTATETGLLIGNATLQDSALLAGGYQPAGSITFSLTAPDGTTATIGSDTASGNGTYLSPNFTATEIGAYTWHVSYGGDSNNNAATDQGGSTQQSSVLANPVVTTGAVSITSPTSATVSGTVVANGSVNNLIQYSADPNLVPTGAATGIGPSLNVLGVAADDNGNVFVAGTAGITEILPNHTTVNLVGGSYSAVAVNGSDLLAFTNGSSVFERLPNGTVRNLYTISSAISGFNYGAIGGIHEDSSGCVAVDPNGDIYFTENAYAVVFVNGGFQDTYTPISAGP